MFWLAFVFVENDFEMDDVFFCCRISQTLETFQGKWQQEYYTTIRPNVVADDAFFGWKRFISKQLLIFIGGNITNLVADFQSNLEKIYCVWRAYRCWFPWTLSFHPGRGLQHHPGHQVQMVNLLEDHDVCNLQIFL